ncbi:MAG TPA: DUF503 domain-containing protein [Chloroflexi bacterium]|nr:DUF503 domain-containing protein [Chloroflexota bacterium]HCU98061.1 DUF503 domain-containing protein [Chloroflexota bacterium]|tara:strand:+ start:3566 stop:3850 length:285 start_codon:yes stop_codon:yes gene_type:complete
MIVGSYVIELYLEKNISLKQKRSQIKSLLTRLNREFNIAVSETDHHDKWQSAQISIVTISNSRSVVESILRKTVRWIEKYRPDILVVSVELEWR